MSIKAVKDSRTLSALVVALRAAAKSIPKSVNTIAQETLDELVFELINKTPVDTSLALSNWRVGLIVPEFDAVPAHSLGKEGSSAAQSRATAYLIAKSVIKTKLPTTRVSYVSNNSAHIVELAEGKSAQQPDSFWIQRIVAKVDAKAQAKLRALVNGN